MVAVEGLPGRGLSSRLSLPRLHSAAHFFTVEKEGSCLMSKFAECFPLVLQVCVLCLMTEGLKLPEKITISNITCLKKEYSANKYRTVIWDGRALRKNCRIVFKVPDAKGYKFIVKITKFVIKDCSFRLSYFYGSTSSAKKIFNCHSSPSSHEVENVQYLYIQFDASNTSPSAVELKVFGKNNSQFWKIWLGVLIVIMLICIVYCMKKASLLCPDSEDSSNNPVTTQQPTTQSQPQSETEDETTVPLRRSSISSTFDVTTAGALVLVEQPTEPPPYVFSFHYEHPSSKRSSCRPPPPYDECVMD